VQARAENEGQQLSFQTLSLPRPVRVDYPWEKDELTQDLSNPGRGRVLLLEAPQAGQNLILAYAELRLDSAHRGAWVRHLVVDSPWRRHQLGRILAQEMRHWAAQQGAAYLTAVTTARSYPAIRFWQAMGFSFCGYHEHYYPRQAIALFFGAAL
jgi:ribosomal protein S18 acetylase RimI-like enzyme